MAANQTEPTWEELMGSNQWEGLLSPLNLKLRQLIIHCGDLVQATGDTFIGDSKSKYWGWSRYDKTSFFESLILPSANKTYDVKAFLYATFPNKLFDAPESNWIGYVAVTKDEVYETTGRREIYVVWRGTVRLLEWVNDLDFLPVSAKPLLKPGSDDEDAKVMEGWLNIYISQNPNSPLGEKSARTQVQSKIEELLGQYKDQNVSLIFTGHSLGAALAVLSAFDVVENEIASAKIQVAAFVLACPKVGDEAFRDKLMGFNKLKILHIRNLKDLVPYYPLGFGYVEAGIQVQFYMDKSPYLKSSLGVGDQHNLQGYLHLVAGWNGADQDFELKVQRSLALVNKAGDLLNDENAVPASWWVAKNNGMVLDENGEWIEGEPAAPEF